jgi:hypothetical protein
VRQPNSSDRDTFIRNTRPCTQAASASFPGEHREQTLQEDECHCRTGVARLALQKNQIDPCCADQNPRLIRGTFIRFSQICNFSNLRFGGASINKIAVRIDDPGFRTFGCDSSAQLSFQERK